MSDAATLPAPAVIATENDHRASDGATLFSRHWSSAEADAGRAAAIVVMHGYAEHCGRYRELAEFLVRAGHPVAAIDARGHGHSPGQRGHIDSYDRYVDDLHGFATAVHERYPNRALVVLGHSNGGLTALRMVETRPAIANSLILTSPLVALRPSHMPLARGPAGILAKFIGKLPLPNGLKTKELTHDPAILAAHRSDPLINSSSTARWYISVLDAMSDALASLEAVRLPVLVFEADSDPIVLPQAITRMYEALPSSDKELVVCVDSFHELLNEIGREQTYRRITAWLAARDHGAAA
jgi:acylglycerol lipase